MHHTRTRREFLQQFARIVAGAMFPAECLWQTAVALEEQGKTKFKVSKWTGDNPRRGHEFRDAEFPTFPDKPERTVDFAIVGGGIAGLTSAWQLRDHDFLLLDQYETFGGQSRGSEYRGIGYSYGPIAIGSVDGIYGQLFNELGLTPLALPAQDIDFLWERKWRSLAEDCNYEGTGSRRCLKKLMAEAKAALPPIELTPESTQSAELVKLDGTGFSQVLSSYDQQFLNLLESVTKTVTTGSIGQLSALAGYSIVNGLLGQGYVFSGGNQAISRALIAKLGGESSLQMVSGAFVWKVELKSNGATVLYSTADGQAHNVFCKHAIIATPPMVAWRQVSNLDDAMRAALMKFKYGAYMVANCLLNKPLFSQSMFQNIVGQPFSFTDIVVAEKPYSLSRSAPKDGASVLTVMQPSSPGSGAREQLLTGDRRQLAMKVQEQMATLIEHLDEHLEEIVMTRWGHALVVPGVDHFAKLRRIIAAHCDSPYSLAYSSTQGMPRFESAVRAAHFAADRARAKVAKVSIVLPEPWVSRQSMWSGS